MALGFESSWTGNIGASHIAPQIGRKRYHSAGVDEGQTGQFAEIATGRCHVPTTTQVLRGMIASA